MEGMVYYSEGDYDFMVYNLRVLCAELDEDGVIVHRKAKVKEIVTEGIPLDKSRIVGYYGEELGELDPKKHGQVHIIALKVKYDDTKETRVVPLRHVVRAFPYCELEKYPITMNMLVKACEERGEVVGVVIGYGYDRYKRLHCILNVRRTLGEKKNPVTRTDPRWGVFLDKYPLNYDRLRVVEARHIRGCARDVVYDRMAMITELVKMMFFSGKTATVKFSKYNGATGDHWYGFTHTDRYFKRNDEMQICDETLNFIPRDEPSYTKPKSGTWIIFQKGRKSKYILPFRIPGLLPFLEFFDSGEPLVNISKLIKSCTDHRTGEETVYSRIMEFYFYGGSWPKKAEQLFMNQLWFL